MGYIAFWSLLLKYSVKIEKIKHVVSTYGNVSFVIDGNRVISTIAVKSAGSVKLAQFRNLL